MVTSGYCHFWSLSLLVTVTVTSGYCHFWSLSLPYTPRDPDLGSAHSKDRAWSLSLLVIVTSGYCHFCTHHGSLDLSSAHFKDRAWSLSLLVTVTSVHTTGVLTLVVHTLKTEPGHCHFCTHHGSPDLSSAHYKGQSLVTVTTGYCPFCTHHGSLVTVTFGYCHFWLLSFLYTPRES